MAIAYISHPECVAHEMGPGHPEQPARLAAIGDRLQSSALYGHLEHHEAPLVDRARLEAVHDSGYLDALEKHSPDEGRVQLDPDTAMNPHSLRAAQRAAGAVVTAVDLVMSNRHRQAFCAVRPPGHHAERGRAMGFCIYNNIAVGARYAIDQYGLTRVAIVDFDVHHGNGTEHIVAGDERILFCSTFQHPFYPHSGEDCDAGNVVNTPLAEGSGSEEFRQAVRDHWLPRLKSFAPQLLMVSAGFDAHRDDAMAGMNLEDDDYRWVTAELRRIAEQSSEGRMVSALEGGYELQALGRSAEAHLSALID